MKTITYDIIIDRISEPFGEYPGTVEVHHHIEGGNLAHGERDGFETTRVTLPSEAVNADGTYNEDEIYKAVRATIGEEDVIEVMNTYDYATDAEMGEIEANTVQEAYAKLRKKITAAMIEDGATLWVENADDDSTEPRLTLGLNAE